MKKIDEIIQMVREEVTVANLPTQSGGFSSRSPAEGPTAGFDPIMGSSLRRRKNGKLDMRSPFVKKYGMLLRSLGLT